MRLFGTVFSCGLIYFCLFFGGQQWHSVAQGTTIYQALDTQFFVVSNALVVC